MKIGIFDSGVGGLILLKSISQKLPAYDYVYLGDTERVPYGNRSQKEIYEYTKQAVEYLFTRDCALIVVACNTASTRALRKLQRTYLPKRYPNRRILGVIIPTVEAVVARQGIERVGVLATAATVKSNVVAKEFRKINPKVQIFQQAAPELVPLIEENKIAEATTALKQYTLQLLKHNVQAILLGCTHYPLLKRQLRKIVGKQIEIFSQDTIIPAKLRSYLKRHPEIETKLSKRGKIDLRVTKMSDHYRKLSRAWLGSKAKPTLIELNK